MRVGILVKRPDLNLAIKDFLRKVMACRPTDPSFSSYFAKVQRVAQRYEEDIIASKRFVYARTENNRRIYVEIATGREVPVMIPELMFRSRIKQSSET